MSSRKVSGGAAKPATTQPQPPAEPASPPWQAILEAMKPPSISLYRVYKRAGITKSRRYWLRRAPDLRLSVAYRLALAAKVDPATYMVAVAQAQHQTALVPDPNDGAKVPPGFVNRTGLGSKCSLCGKAGHNKRRCRSSISSASLLLLARGAAMAASDLTKKGT